MDSRTKKPHPAYKHNEKLRICNRTLAVTTMAVLLSSIQLEATGGSSASLVWLHIAVCSLMTALATRHIYLHFKWVKWESRLFGSRNRMIRWLTISGALTILTGIAATVQWLVTGIHSGIGALHGKIGFVFILLAILHTIKRFRHI